MALEVCLTVFAAAALAAGGLNWLALIPWRRAAGEHWTERARRLYPVRVSAALNQWLIPANCVLAQRLLVPEAHTPWLAAALCGWVGALVGSYPSDCEIFPGVPFWDWLQYVVAVWLLRLGFWGIFIAGALLMPAAFGWPMVTITSVVLFLFFLAQYGMFVRLARELRLFKPPTERLRRIVSEATRRMNVPVRAVWEVTGPYSYAAALPTTRELLFSTRLLERQADDEVAAICAHELGHLSESRRALVGRLAGSLWPFPLLFFGAAVSALGAGGFAVVALATGLLMVFLRRLARRMEQRADVIAVENQRESGTYARALERLYQANQMPAVMTSNRLPHPHLYDRLLAAGLTPEYPRPRPPAKSAWHGALMWILLGLLVGLALAQAQTPVPSV